MFTLEQIKKAHDKVQTGADFPIYIQELIDLGVEGIPLMMGMLLITQLNIRSALIKIR
jgi:hypothetical protein